eukprot:Gb_20150 [translate_table: standard]
MEWRRMEWRRKAVVGESRQQMSSQADEAKDKDKAANMKEALQQHGNGRNRLRGPRNTNEARAPNFQNRDNFSEAKLEGAPRAPNFQNRDNFSDAKLEGAPRAPYFQNRDNFSEAKLKGAPKETPLAASSSSSSKAAEATPTKPKRNPRWRKRQNTPRLHNANTQQVKEKQEFAIVKEFAVQEKQELAIVKEFAVQEEQELPIVKVFAVEMMPSSSRSTQTNLNEMKYVKECGINLKPSISIWTPTHQVEFEGRTIQVTLTADSHEVEEWVLHQQRSTSKLFGMDLEWKPNFYKGQDNRAALLQLCGDAGCLILQLFYMDVMPSSLIKFLNDDQIRLAGVEIEKDADKLATDYDLTCKNQSLVELSTLAVNTLGKPELKGSGLKKLASEVLGLSLVKSKKISMSNWEKAALSRSQIEYACIDAYISFAIAQKLLEDLP